MADEPKPSRYVDQPIGRFLAQLASGQSQPSGGSAAAIVVAAAAALATAAARRSANYDDDAELAARANPLCEYAQ